MDPAIIFKSAGIYKHGIEPKLYCFWTGPLCYKVPDEPGVGYGQTVEEVHEDHHDEEDEGNEDDVAHRVATLHKHQVLFQII